MRRRFAAGAGDVAPAVLVLALLVWTAGQQAGFAVTAWTPPALIVAVVLAMRLVVAPPAWRSVPRPTLVAVAALAGYTAWSGLSILWAQDAGIAWEGANRTLLYLLVFALLALWPLSPRQAGGVAAAWSLAIVVFAAVTLLDLSASDSPARLLQFDRLLGPAGYVNASAALWLMALWPAVVLAAARAVPWTVRGVLAGGAVLLCDVALLSQSRGSLIAAPLTAALVLLAGPWRVRTFYVLVLVGAGVLASAGPLLDIGRANLAGRSIATLVDSGIRTAFVAAVAVGLIAGAAALAERRVAIGDARRRGVHRAGAGVAVALVVFGAVGGLVVVGSPAAAAGRAWDSFKGGYAEGATGSRLTSGLGSNRYDFYRVGLDAFARHPLAGIGADNFKAEYLRHGRSAETPTYAHSAEIRALASTGLVGAVLLLTFLGGAGVTVVRTLRAGGLAAGAVTACAGAFAYWAIHGSADWFWEFAGLGAPAFAMLAIACAVGTRPAARRERGRRDGPHRRGDGPRPGGDRRPGAALARAARRRRGGPDVRLRTRAGDRAPAPRRAGGPPRWPRARRRGRGVAARRRHGSGDDLLRRGAPAQPG